MEVLLELFFFLHLACIRNAPDAERKKRLPRAGTMLDKHEKDSASENFYTITLFERTS